MARISQIEKIDKQKQARTMYVQGLTLSFIADTVGVTTKSIKAWADAGAWDKDKQAKAITPAGIKAMILQCAADLKEGRAPKANPDQLVKLAAAYEKLSDKDKNLSYLLDFSSALIDKIFSKAQAATTEAGKEHYIRLNQELVKITDELVKEAQDKVSHD